MSNLERFDLLPCPMCGDTNAEVGELKCSGPLMDGFIVECGGCSLNLDRQESREAAVEGWNRRATPAPAETIGIPCPTAPERIWLQVDPDPEEDGKPVYTTSDVTWCEDKINDTDTLYVRADLVAPPAEAQPGALSCLTASGCESTPASAALPSGRRN